MRQARQGVRRPHGYRLPDGHAYCLHEGLSLDIDVYDSATWSCLAGLTQRSVDNRGDGLKSYLGTAARSVAIDRLRKSIRPLDALLRAGARPAFDHSFGWWYLPGPYGKRRENEAAMLATLGRSVIGREAERIILEAARAGKPTVLKAAGWDCIAAAHAYAAEPQLFSGVDFKDPPPSWTEMVTNPDPKDDSYAVGAWGALEEYDWTDLVTPKGEAKCN